MASKKTLVLGASENTQRYSNMAANRLMSHNHPVVLVGNKEGKIKDTPIVKGMPAEKGIDTVTLYLNPANQKPYYDYILGLHPKRIIFNPGTENPELKSLAEANSIQPVEACTLVMLSIGNY